MRFSGSGQQTGGRRVTASTAQWLVDGSVPSRGRRAWAWARRSVAGIGLPVSPERGERRESSSASPAASACPGPDGSAARRGLSGVFWRLCLPMRRRADGSRGSALIRGTGTGGRAGALARSGRRAVAGLLLLSFAGLGFSGLLAAPAFADVLVSNIGESGNDFGSLSDFDQAQAFTTGDNTSGYTVTSVEFSLSGSRSGGNSVLSVSIYSNSSGAPGSSLGTLGTVTAGTPIWMYSTATGIDLDASSTYFVVIDVTGSTERNVANTGSDDENSTFGWTISNDSLYRSKDSKRLVDELRAVQESAHQRRGEEFSLGRRDTERSGAEGRLGRQRDHSEPVDVRLHDEVLHRGRGERCRPNHRRADVGQQRDVRVSGRVGYGAHGRGHGRDRLPGGAGRGARTRSR